MSLMNESLEIRRMIEKIVAEEVKKQTASCFRLYKAVVTTEANDETRLCGVKLIGDKTELTIPYASKFSSENLYAGTLVWVATTFNSFRNAVVFDTLNF